MNGLESYLMETMQKRRWEISNRFGVSPSAKKTAAREVTKQSVGLASRTFKKTFSSEIKKLGKVKDGKPVKGRT